MRTDNPLAKLDHARQLLAESHTLEEVKRIKDIAEAAKVYARAAHLGRESQNYAAEIALLAASKAGEILGHLDKKQSSGVPARLAGTSEYSKVLAETNTPDRTARYWQTLADVPEKVRADYIQRVKESPSGEITAAGLLRAARSEQPNYIEQHLGQTDPPTVRINVYFPTLNDKEEFLRLAGRDLRSWNQTIHVGFAEHQDMMEFAQLVAPNNLGKEYRETLVHFTCREDMEDFSRVIGQKVDLLTKTIIFPPITEEEDLRRADT
jgi:hypothetical protein